MIRARHTGCVVILEPSDAANAVKELNNTLFLQQVIGVRQAILQAGSVSGNLCTGH